jgi:hypothetical protein
LIGAQLAGTIARARMFSALTARQLAQGMTLHDRVVAAMQANKQLSPVSKAAYVARLAALQRITGEDSLEQVLLQPSRMLQERKKERKIASALGAEMLQHWAAVG